MLPTETTKPRTNLLDNVILIHGVPKIGKSTLASQAENVLFANTEGGLGSLETFQVPIDGWNNGEQSFLFFCKEFVEGKHNFKILCIDTIDVLLQHCVQYMMNRESVVHPSDLDYGKGWHLVKTELIRPLAKLAVSPYGLILISHTKEIEIETRTTKLTKSIPTLGGYIWAMVEAFVDIILYFHSEDSSDGEKRLIRTKPSERWIAGDRTTRLLPHDPIEIFPPPTNNWKHIEELFKKGGAAKENATKEEIKSSGQGVLLK